MSPDKLEILRKKEYAIYEQEVGKANDPKLYVLLAHLYIEHLLERYIDTKLKKTDCLCGKHGLTFEKKVCLAQSFGGLNAQRIDGILKMNDLRNDCVHKFKHQPTEKQIDDLGRTLGKACKEMKGNRSENEDRGPLLRSYCAYLCGAVLRIVVAAENEAA